MFRIPPKGRLLMGSASLAALAAGAAGAPGVLAAEVQELEEVTVVATRTEKQVFEVPQMVTVLDREHITARIPSTIGDIFRGVPGVSFGNGPRRTGEVPSIRGLSGPGVLILFDGARQSFQSGHDGRFFIDPDLIGRVDIIRGPSSALYGSGALGGVLSFETLSASDLLRADSDWGYRVKAGYQGVHDEWMTGGTFFGRTEKADFIGSLTYRNSDDIELGSGDILPADDEIASGFAKLGYRFSPAVHLDLSYTRFSNDAVEPNSGDAGARADATNPLVDKDITSDNIRSRLQVTPDNPLIDLDLVAYYSRSDVDEDELDSDRRVGREVETTGLRLENISEVALSDTAGLSFAYGGEIYQDEQTGFDSETPDNSRGGVPDASTDFAGAFVQAELAWQSPLGEFLLIPGLRYDRYENMLDGSGDEVTEDDVSPKVSVTLRPVEHWMIFANYAEAFRAPTFNEVFADGIHFQIPLGPGVVAPNFFVSNTNLGPERSETIEFGSGLEFDDLFADGDRLLVKASYYDSDVDGLIDLEVNVEFSPGCFVPGAGPCTSGTSRNVNTEKARIEGFEAELQYVARLAYLYASFSSMTGKDKATGEFVGILQPDTGFVDAGLKLLDDQLRIGTRIEAAGDLDEVNDPALALDSFVKWDLYANWTPLIPALEGFRFDVGVDNVTDTSFARTVPNAIAPGRNVKASVHYTAQF